MVKAAKNCCKECQDHKYCKSRGKCCHYCDHYNRAKCYLAEHKKLDVKANTNDLSFTNYRGDEYGMDDYNNYEEGD